MSFLDPSANVEFGTVSQGELVKALEAGYGTDSAAMTGGRSLIPQDIQNTLQNALKFGRNDFKVMNLVRKNPVYSTIHEYTRQTDVGDEIDNFVAEGGESQENTSQLERITKAMKYLQTYRKITLQMRVAKTIEDAEALEKTSGTLEVLRSAEKANFHGDSSVNPVQFDGIIKQIKDGSTANIVDLRGKLISSTEGEESFNEIARKIYEGGGYATHAFMPPVLAQDVQNLVKDRLRLNTGDNRAAAVVEKYPTPFSDEILIAGSAGPDKFFRVKTSVVASGDSSKRPDAPTIALAAQAKTGGTGFLVATAGTYYYTVHAVNQYGVSPASAAGSVAVADGQQVQITITPAAGNATTGFIICRSKVDAADGTDTREMIKVSKASTPTTIHLDQNDDLPGTGELIVLSYNEMDPSIQWDQFLPLMKFDLYPTNAAIIPFLIILFGAMDVKVPWRHGLVKNVSFTGLDWF